MGEKVYKGFPDDKEEHEQRKTASGSPLEVQKDEVYQKLSILRAFISRFF